MAGKSRDFSVLAAGIADAGKPVPAEAERGRGRPNADTRAMQLRLPTDLLDWLIRQAAEASIQEGRNVTPQQIILKHLAKARGEA